jgi:hypothetical protein
MIVRRLARCSRRTSCATGAVPRPDTTGRMRCSDPCNVTLRSPCGSGRDSLLPSRDRSTQVAAPAECPFRVVGAIRGGQRRSVPFA